jgi:hypothetical protein
MSEFTFFLLNLSKDFYDFFFFFFFIIIIIITTTIWHYNPMWVFAFSAKSLQVLLSLAVSFQFLLLAFLNLP